MLFIQTTTGIWRYIYIYIYLDIYVHLMKVYEINLNKLHNLMKIMSPLVKDIQLTLKCKKTTSI